MAKRETTAALAGEINVAEIKKLQKRVGINSETMDLVVNKLVKEHCKQLDDVMTLIQNILDSDEPASDLELDDLTLRLPNTLYFASECQEALGIREDVAKAVKMELYNEIYAQTPGTAANKTAAAEAVTQSEYLVHTAYQRAYKKVKLRMEAGYEQLQSIKKVITRRMLEYELAGATSGPTTSKPRTAVSERRKNRGK